MNRLRFLAIVAVSLLSVTASIVLLGAQTKTNSSDLLTNKQVKELLTNAKTRVDHLRLQKHFLAEAAQYEAKADEHAAEALVYRKNPTFMESKNPSGMNTVAHCERFAQLDRDAAKEARELASAHEHMAAAAQ